MTQQHSDPMITVKCIGGKGCDMEKQQAFFVSVSDMKGQAVFEGFTDERGFARFSVKGDMQYRICVSAPDYLTPDAAHRWLTFPQGCDSGVYFVFHRQAMCCPAIRTVFLSDEKYGFPILKGEIRLWPDPMK